MPKFGMTPIECSLDPSCGGGGWWVRGGLPYFGGSWPANLIPPPMQTVTLGYQNPPVGGSGILQTIMQTFTGNTGVVTPCNCPPGSSNSEESCSCTDPANMAIQQQFNVNDLIARAKLFAEQHPIMTLVAVGGIGYVIFKDKK